MKREKPKIRLKAKAKVGACLCEFCGGKQPLCYTCRKCGFSICAECLIQNQSKFLCASAVAWICPNCANWETL